MAEVFLTNVCTKYGNEIPEELERRGVLCRVVRLEHKAFAGQLIGHVWQ